MTRSAASVPWSRTTAPTSASTVLAAAARSERSLQLRLPRSKHAASSLETQKTFCVSRDIFKERNHTQCPYCGNRHLAYATLACLPCVSRAPWSVLCVKFKFYQETSKQIDTSSKSRTRYFQQTAQIRFQIRGRLDGEFTARAWGTSQMPAKDEWCDAPVRQA